MAMWPQPNSKPILAEILGQTEPGAGDQAALVAHIAARRKGAQTEASLDYQAALLEQRANVMRLEGPTIREAIQDRVPGCPFMPLRDRTVFSWKPHASTSQHLSHGQSTFGNCKPQRVVPLVGLLQPAPVSRVYGQPCACWYAGNTNY